MSREDAPRLSGMKYQVESVLGSEGASTVVLVNDPKAFSKRYALKRLRLETDEDEARLAFARAMPAASAKLKHPSILAYHDFAPTKSWFKTTGGELLMEYVEGRSLDRLGPAPRVPHWILIFRQVAAGLAHMHRRQVQHGSLDPSHVLLGRNGQVKLINYGMNLIEGSGLPPVAKAFAAPEVRKGEEVTDQSDVYALGALMYGLLTGRSPVASKKAESEGDRLTTPAALNPQVPAALSNLIVTCMKVHPSNRPAGAFEVLQEIEALATATTLDDEALKGLAVAST